MNKLAFGLTMMIIGIGGTFLTLTILIWSIELLKKLFPLEPAQAPSTWQFFSLERIPPQWREKLPIETIRYQWNQGLVPLQRASVAWMQKLPIERLQDHWNQTLRLERITSPENRRAILSSVQARIFGRASPTSRSEDVSAGENRDETRKS